MRSAGPSNSWPALSGRAPSRRMVRRPHDQPEGNEGKHVKFGIHLGTVNPKFWGDIAEAADRLGFESLWVPEHVVVPFSATGSPHHGSDHPPIPSNVPIY